MPPELTSRARQIADEIAADLQGMSAQRFRHAYVDPPAPIWSSLIDAVAIAIDRRLPSREIS